MSLIRSSSTSPASTTAILRPCADGAALRCSTPKRARRSRCSTTAVVAVASASRRACLRRFPFIPDPTSTTTSATAMPRPVAHSVSRATCRSRSPRWSRDDTRAYSTVRAGALSHVDVDEDQPPGPLRRDRHFPSRNQRYAVNFDTPTRSPTLTSSCPYARTHVRQPPPTQPATVGRPAASRTVASAGTGRWSSVRS